MKFGFLWHQTPPDLQGLFILLCFLEYNPILDGGGQCTAIQSKSNQFRKYSTPWRSPGRVLPQACRRNGIWHLDLQLSAPASSAESFQVFCPEYPASYIECISVSAVRYDNTVPAYSNYGQYITLCAPGGDLNVDQNWDNFGDGILQQTHNGSNFSTFYYYFMEGTSPACALVSGVAALIVSKSTLPLSPLQVTDILKGTATDLGTVGWDQYYGSGLVNAYQALLQTP